MKKNTIMAIGLAMSFVAAQALAEQTPAAVQGDAAAGKTKSETCGGCHGADGNPAAAVFPKLAGQHPSYLTKQLRVFRSQKRVDQMVMNTMAESLTDADIADISAWLAKNKVIPEKAENKDLGHNPASVYPALGGQYSSYVGKSLHDYKSGERGNEVMQTITNRLSDEEINAVSDYVSGLQ